MQRRKYVIYFISHISCILSILPCSEKHNSSCVAFVDLNVLLHLLSYWTLAMTSNQKVIFPAILQTSLIDYRAFVGKLPNYKRMIPDISQIRLDTDFTSATLVAAEIFGSQIQKIKDALNDDHLAITAIDIVECDALSSTENTFWGFWRPYQLVRIFSGCRWTAPTTLHTRCMLRHTNDQKSSRTEASRRLPQNQN